MFERDSSDHTDSTGLYSNIGSESHDETVSQPLPSEPSEAVREPEGTVPHPKIATWFIIGVCVGMYLLTCPSGQWNPSEVALIQYGAKVNHLIDEGQWWRLLSNCFLHGFTWHLGLNCLALLVLGGELESALGSRPLIFFYVFCGLVASLASYYMNPIMSVGASGSLFGFFGILLVCNVRIFFHYRKQGIRVPAQLIFSMLSGLVILSLNLMLGFAIPFIDNSAHIGGLAAGTLLGLFIPLGQRRMAESRIRRPAIHFAALVSAAILAFTGTSVYQYASANDEIQLQREVRKVRQKAIEQRMASSGEQPPAWLSDLFAGPAEKAFRRGIRYHQQKKYEEAEAAYRETIHQDPEKWSAYFNLGLVYMALSEHDKAIEMFLSVLSLNPDAVDAHVNLGIIYRIRGAFELAIESFESAIKVEPNHQRAYSELARTCKILGLPMNERR